MMYIEYKSTKLEKQCKEFKQACRAFGINSAKKLIQRINEIKAAPTLADLNMFPPTRCHALKGDRKGQFAVYIEHPKRLIFEPLGKKEDIYVNGVLELKKVTGVENNRGR